MDRSAGDGRVERLSAAHCPPPWGPAVTGAVTAPGTSTRRSSASTSRSLQLLYVAPVAAKTSARERRPSTARRNAYHSGSSVASTTYSSAPSTATNAVSGMLAEDRRSTSSPNRSTVSGGSDGAGRRSSCSIAVSEDQSVIV